MYKPNIPDQALGLSTALLNFTVETKRSTVGLTDGYKNWPVPKRLVGPGPMPPNLSPAYTKIGGSLSRPRSAIKHGKIKTGSQASLRLGRLPIRPERGQGQTHPRPVANTDNQIRELLTGPTCPVLQFMSLIGLLTAKKKKAPRLLHPHLKWWWRKAMCSKVNHCTH